MTRDRRIAGRWALRRTLPVAVLVVAFLAGPHALAQSAAGGIQGQVVNGADETPVADVQVTVQLFSAQGELGTLSTTTDRRGRFAFEELPEGLAGYQVIAAYGGTEFRTVAAAYTPGQTVEQTVTVWEPTSDPAEVTLTDYVVWLDREGEGVALQHDFSWDNAGSTAFVGEGGQVVSVPLPPGAADFQYLGTFLENPGEVRGQRYISDAPIVPGPTSATLRYGAPPISELTLEIPFPATSVQLFVPQDVQVTSSQLRLAGTITDQGLTYQVYAAQDVAADTVLRVSMSEVEGSDPSSPVAWILAGAAALIALVLLTVWITGRRKARARRPVKAARRSRAAPVPSGARRAATSNGKPGPQPARVRAEGNGDGPLGGSEDVDLIVDEIAALDLSFERGLLDERTYKRLRVAAKDRLLRAEGARAEGRTR